MVVLVCLMAVSSVKGSSVIVETQEHGTFCSSFLHVHSLLIAVFHSNVKCLLDWLFQLNNPSVFASLCADH